MNKNMGTVDRVLRAMIAVAIVVLFLTGVIGGALAVVLLVIAAVLLLSSLLGSCPGYLPLGMSTRKGPDAP